MEDVDPDEELARRLHREMNGLNRVRRRAAPRIPPGELQVGSLSGRERVEASDTCLSATLQVVGRAMHCRQVWSCRWQTGNSEGQQAIKRTTIWRSR